METACEILEEYVRTLEDLIKENKCNDTSLDLIQHGVSEQARLNGFGTISLSKLERIEDITVAHQTLLSETKGLLHILNQKNSAQLMRSSI